MVDQLRALMNRPIADHERVRLFVLAAAVLTIVAAALWFTRPTTPSPSASSISGSGTAASPGAAAPAPGEPGSSLPAWQPAAQQFADAYARYLAGTGSVAQLPATAAARRLAGGAGPIPEGLRAGKLTMRAPRSAPVAGSTVRVTLTAQDVRHTYPVQVDLSYGDGRWRVDNIVPPDFYTLAAKPPAQRPAPAALRHAAAAFARRYVRYVDGHRAHMPAKSRLIRRVIRDGRDPLSHAITNVTQLPIRLTYGPRQGNNATVTATVTEGVLGSFTYVMRRQGQRWTAYAFVLGGDG